jgi:serine/threonine protein kinase
MAAPETTNTFLDVVRKSGLIDPRRLTQYLSDLDGRPGTPQGLARALIRDGLLTLFQAEQLVQGKWRGFDLGKYRVLELLGSGGMGRVFLCQHLLMSRLVAVKVLPTVQAADPQAVERFYREARAAASLDHPNIVRAYDVEHDQRLHYLIMEFVDGRSLHHIVAEHSPLDPAHASHYIAQAAAGLHHAHEAGWVHRDIKPGNLLVDRQGVVKILDMGLARFFREDRDGITRRYDDNAVLGTADYLAPEQVSNSHDVDIRADVYSLGATFYFLLTGKAPFEEGNVGQKLLWHQVRDPEPVRGFRPEVPEALAAVVERMMEKDRERRYQTPGEVIEALGPWTGEPLPPPLREGPRFSPLVRKLIQAAAPQTMTAAPDSTIRRQTAVAPPRSLGGTPSGRALSATTRLPSPRAEAEPEAPARKRWLPWLAVAVPVLALAAVGAWWLFAGRQPGAVGTTNVKGGPPVLRGPVSPEEAARHVNERVTVEMTVKNTGVSKTQKTLFLNSEPDYTDPRNFTVVAHSTAPLGGGDVQEALARYRDRKIRVTGVVTLYNDRPQIVLTDPSLIEILKD